MTFPDPLVALIPKMPLFLKCGVSVASGRSRGTFRGAHTGLGLQAIRL